MKIPKPKKMAGKDPVTDEDLDNAIDTLIEANQIMANKALMKTIKDYSEKKIKKIDSIQKLRKIADDLNFKDED